MKNTSKSQQQLLTFSEAACNYNIPKDRLFRAIKSGKLRPKKSGKVYMISERSIKRYLAKYEGRVV